MSHTDDLVRQAADGNMGAFAYLVQTHRASVLRVAHGIVGNAHDAEDVGQATFVKVWQNLDGYRPGSTFSAWLHRITVNAALDKLRSRREETPLTERERDDRPTPERAILQDEMQTRVRRAVQALPPQSRAALVLREYEGLSYKEIAEALDIPIGTVMSRLSYARRALRERLAGHREQDVDTAVMDMPDLETAGAITRQ